MEITATGSVPDVGYHLECQGLLERDTGNVYLTPKAVDTSDEDPSNPLLGK